MASQIATILDAFVAATVSDGVNTTITAKDADQTLNSLTTAQMPLRLLSPIDPLGGASATSGNVYATSGGPGYYEIVWTIYDVLYHTPLAQTRGHPTVMPLLFAYMADYFAMLSDTSRLNLPNNVTANAATLTADVLEYPLQSGHWHFAVRAAITIREVICP